MMPVMPMRATSTQRVCQSPKAPKEVKNMANELTSLMMTTVLLKSPVVTKRLRYARVLTCHFLSTEIG